MTRDVYLRTGAFMSILWSCHVLFCQKFEDCISYSGVHTGGGLNTWYNGLCQMGERTLLFCCFLMFCELWKAKGRVVERVS